MKAPLRAFAALPALPPLRAVAGILAVAALLVGAPAFAQETPPERLSFDAAVQRAMDRNPSAREAAAEVRRAGALVEQARAASLPTLTGAGVYTRLDGDRTAGALVLQPAGALNLGATATLPLVNVRGWVGWRQAGDRLDVAKLSANDVRRTVAIVTARAYIAVVTQKRLVAIAGIARDTAKAHHDFTAAELAGGIGTQLDEARAAQELWAAESLVINQRIALTHAREALGVLVAADVAVDGDAWSFGAMPSLEGALADAGTRRSDVRTRERAELVAEKVVRDGYADYLPTLSAAATAFYQTPGTALVPETGWQAQLVLSVPIFDGGLRYGQEHERRALADEAHLDAEQTLRQARSEVRTAAAELAEADAALAHARASAASATKALELATLAYRGGVTTNLEVIDAERQARDADIQAAIAEDAARQARLDLLAASGRFPAER